jgi:hypothetical protein
VDDDLDSVESGEQAETAEDESLQKRLEKAERQNQELRRSLRKTEVAKEHGEKIAEVVANSGRPANEWADYAVEIKALLPEDHPKAETPEAAPATQEVAEPAAGLKAVATNQPASSPVAPGTDLSAKEIGDLHKTDPAAFQRALQAKYAAS